MIIWYNLPKNVQKLPGAQGQVLLQNPQVFLQRDFVESGQQPKASFQAGHTDNNKTKYPSKYGHYIYLHY